MRRLCSTDYATRYGAFGITVESPLWVVPGTDDLRLAGNRADATMAAIRASLSAFHEQHAAWIDAISGDLDLDTPRGRAITATWQAYAADWLPHSPHVTSKASLSSLARWADLERLRGAGHIVSFLNHVDDLIPALTAVLRDARNAIAQWSGWVTHGLSRPCPAQTSP